jgi:nucleotide-binding universal stress UspA family protein
MQILVAADLSARSDHALDRGFQLAQQLRADLAILHVVDSDLPAAIQQQTAEWAAKALAREIESRRARFAGEVKVYVRTGKAHAEILRMAIELSAALLVIGIKDHRSAGAKPFSETTAGHALKASMLPMLLVRNPASEPYRSVVVGIDFTISCAPAIRQAAQIAPEADIDLVHAYHVPFQGFLGSDAFRSDIAYEQRLEFDDFLCREMQALEARAQSVRGGKEHVRTTLREGQPQSVLRALVREGRVDLLVIATHGRGPMTRAVWGSVALDLLNDPPTDVLIIKPF